MLLIFTQERSATKFNRDTEEFMNPKVTKIEITVEGSPNELYAQNIEYRTSMMKLLNTLVKVLRDIVTCPYALLCTLSLTSNPVC